MIIYSLDDLSLREIKAIRTSLNYITITGIDATFIALLQNKINTQLAEVETHIVQEEKTKQDLLQQAVNNNSKSESPKRGKKP